MANNIDMQIWSDDKEIIDVTLETGVFVPGEVHYGETLAGTGTVGNPVNIAPDILAQIGNNTSEIAAEVSRATSAEIALQQNIDTEGTNRASADNALSARITANATDIAQEISDRESADNTLQNNINAEESARQNADTALQTQITANTNKFAEYRTAADQDAIDATHATKAALGAETDALIRADNALSGRIDTTNSNLTAEISARISANNDLQSQIDAISAASDVTDIVGTHAELESYDTGTLKDNDIIKVLQDETQGDATTYYRWNLARQTFTLIGDEGPYYTRAQTDELLADKQDTISDLATIRDGAAAGATAVQPGALAPVATSGAYSDLTGAPTIGNGTITFTQAGETKGTITTNQGNDTTIALDASPVESVNGKTGAVELTASDVGALPTSGGTMTSQINFVTDTWNGAVGGYRNGVAFGVIEDDAYRIVAVLTTAGFAPHPSSVLHLGVNDSRWQRGYINYIHTRAINNGGDIAVPTTGGTMALLEDLPAAETGTVGQVYTKTESGAEWADASSGGAVDSVNGQTGTVELTAADVGAATTEDLDGYLPLVGGTLTGATKIDITDTQDTGLSSDILTFTVKNSTGTRSRTWRIHGGYNTPDLFLTGGGVYLGGSVGITTANAYTLGSTMANWANVYTAKINNGADIVIPATAGTMALTSDIPAIATSVGATSTDAETVSAKLFYDTVGDIEALINAL